MRAPPGKRQAQAAARREQFLKIALELFTAHGYRGTSVREIARAAGVNEGLLYHYFANKSELFAAVLERYAPFESGKGVLEAAEGRPVGEVLRALGDQFLSTLQERRALVVTILSEGPTDPELGEILGEFLQSTRARIAEFLALRQGTGEIKRQVNLDAAAQAFVGGLLFALISVILSSKAIDHPRGEPAATLDHLVSVLLDGMIDTALPSG